MAPKLPAASMDTILTFDNRDNQSEWSVEWSTTNIPGMDNAAGSSTQRRHRGRRRLRVTALALSCCLAMHARVVTPALTTGLLYYLFLAGAVVMLANPLRHFEVYVGQWSISGPGRAFRVLPMLDGIGLAMCISSIIRAINYCTMAAITMLYVVHSASDSKLPFTYCSWKAWFASSICKSVDEAPLLGTSISALRGARNWNLKVYDPIKENTTIYALHERRSMSAMKSVGQNNMAATTVGLGQHAWRRIPLHGSTKGLYTLEVETCNETYHGGYPSLYSPPAYNYFYLELSRLSPTYGFSGFNVPLLICLICIWVFLWSLMVAERVMHGRLVWNNLYTWIVCVPWIWAVCLVIVAIQTVAVPKRFFKQILKLGHNDILTGLADALVISLYIHSAGTGTELIHGKGLNFYASGHIDPVLNSDNVWHSGLVLAVALLHAVGATACGVGDVPQNDASSVYRSTKSIMWLIPMYSKCSSYGNYAHASSCIIFGGLSFSYVVVAYTLIKTALHTIFEYRVKLVFWEQYVVGALVCSCLLISLPYATTGGLALLESVDSLMTELAMPLVCALELLALVYVYRSGDFRSDINIATEENTCNTRITTSWRVIPFLVIMVLIGEIVLACWSDLPSTAMCMAVAPLLAAALAVPLRALHNAIVFLHPAPRRGV